MKKEIRGRNSQQKVPKQSEDKAKTEQSNSLNLSQSEFSDSMFGYHQGYPAHMYNQGIYSSEQPPPPHQDYTAGMLQFCHFVFLKTFAMEQDFQ